MNQVRLRKTTGGDDEDNEQTKENIDYPEIDTSDEEVKPNQDKPATSCDSCCDMSNAPKKIVLAASVIILFFFWWNQVCPSSFICMAGNFPWDRTDSVRVQNVKGHPLSTSTHE